MKLSLKFTTMALLLGVVCHTSLNAAENETPELTEFQQSPKIVLQQFNNMSDGPNKLSQFAIKYASCLSIDEQSTLMNGLTMLPRLYFQRTYELAKNVKSNLPRELIIRAEERAKIAEELGGLTTANQELSKQITGLSNNLVVEQGTLQATLKDFAETQDKLQKTEQILANTQATLQETDELLKAEKKPLKLTVSAPELFVVKPEDLPAFLAIRSANIATETHPAGNAGEVAILAVRAALGTKDLPAVLDTLKNIERLLKHVAVDAVGNELSEALSITHSFAALRNHLSVMPPRLINSSRKTQAHLVTFKRPRQKLFLGILVQLQ